MQALTSRDSISEDVDSNNKIKRHLLALNCSATKLDPTRLTFQPCIRVLGTCSSGDRSLDRVSGHKIIDKE